MLKFKTTDNNPGSHPLSSESIKNLRHANAQTVYSGECDIERIIRFSIDPSDTVSEKHRPIEIIWKEAMMYDLPDEDIYPEELKILRTELGEQWREQKEEDVPKIFMVNKVEAKRVDFKKKLNESIIRMDLSASYVPYKIFTRITTETGIKKFVQIEVKNCREWYKKIGHTIENYDVRLSKFYNYIRPPRETPKEAFRTVITKHLDVSANVLHLGLDVDVVLIISSALDDDKKFVVCVPYDRQYNELEIHKTLNKLNFGTEQKIVSQDSLTFLEIPDGLSEAFEFSFIKYGDLEGKYGIKFDTIIESGIEYLYYILKNDCDSLKNINTVMRYNIACEEKVDDIVVNKLKETGFTLVEKNEANPNVVEVWKRKNIS